MTYDKQKARKFYKVADDNNSDKGDAFTNYFKNTDNLIDLGWGGATALGTYALSSLFPGSKNNRLLRFLLSLGVGAGVTAFGGPLRGWLANKASENGWNGVADFVDPTKAVGYENFKKNYSNGPYDSEKDKQVYEWARQGRTPLTLGQKALRQKGIESKKKLLDTLGLSQNPIRDVYDLDRAAAKVYGVELPQYPVTNRDIANDMYLMAGSDLATRKNPNAYKDLIKSREIPKE